MEDFKPAVSAAQFKPASIPDPVSASAPQTGQKTTPPQPVKYQRWKPTNGD